MPEDGYGWEKLFSERAGTSPKTSGSSRVWRAITTSTARTARGNGGREKAPAAICRKVIEAKLSGRHQIKIWGDGRQTGSFMYIDDCLLGTKLIMDSSIDFPINLGSAEMVSINQLVDIAEEIAGVKLERSYDVDAPQKGYGAGRATTP